MPLLLHEISGLNEEKDFCRQVFEDQNPSDAITIRQSTHEMILLPVTRG